MPWRLSTGEIPSVSAVELVGNRIAVEKVSSLLARKKDFDLQVQIERGDRNLHCSTRLLSCGVESVVISSWRSI